jgi:hypothetical protein
MVKAFRERRDYLVKSFSEIDGVKISEPQVQIHPVYLPIPLIVILHVLSLFCLLFYSNIYFLFSCRAHFIYSLISAPITEKKLRDLVKLRIPSLSVDICWIKARYTSSILKAE